MLPYSVTEPDISNTDDNTEQQQQQQQEQERVQDGVSVDEERPIQAYVPGNGNRRRENV